uniref:HAT C-terminal dimerisation domain-containing protein n=1 Tax=Cyprinus carpio TaxID=7962 RepID=A0A8C1YIY5_CYPCA
AHCSGCVFTVLWVTILDKCHDFHFSLSLYATCSVCSVKILVKHEGKTALHDHAKMKKHQSRVQVTRQTKAISSFMITKNSEDKITVAELTSTNHGVRHGHSYLSTDCGNKVSAKIFSDSEIATKMSCGRTKSEALVENVLAPFSQQRLAAELQKAHCFAVCSDAFNSGHTKLFPYTVQYFCASEGVKYGLLDFYDDSNESSEAIFKQIGSITENNGLSVSQISAYGADNASVNYGWHNSVFQKLREANPQIVKGNCKCNIINNTVKAANHVFSTGGCDVEAFVLKVYSEFSCSAKKVELLKDFCEFTNTKYREILRHVPTCWLSLLPAIQRILECWPALKFYFVSLGKEDCPSIIWTFVCGASDAENVECTVAECILAFMHNLINLLGCSRVTVLLKAKQILRSLLPQQQEQFRSLVDKFFEKAVLYLEDKFDFNQVLAHIGCLSLHEGQSLQWSELEVLVEKLALDVEEDKLYGDVVIPNEVLHTIPTDLSPDRMWAYFFSKATESTELLKVVAFVFSIPVSNAYAERVFSHMEDVWSDKRNAMVKSELQVIWRMFGPIKEMQW